MIVISILWTALFIYLGFSVIYFHLFSWGALFPLKDPSPVDDLKRKYAVLIPGYKEDAVIVSVAEAALKQDASKEWYDVIVIADSFQSETLQRLAALPIKVVEVEFEVSTKSKALNKAMEVVGDDYDVAVILDADNVMEEDFLRRIDAQFDLGFTVVQGHRVAKNTGTAMAQLDAISEEVNNSVFRKGHRVFGLSSALIGSGMAFDYAFFKDIMARIKAIGGFD
ncbi:glycosyltransferase [Cryomorphaceae bacterium]|nr:glycosyltransferase [Cryomorphaceae bacterium]